MKRFILIALAVPTALLAGKSMSPMASLLAADDAYAKASQRDGEWTATRAVALPQSEMFVPQRVKVLKFGENLPDPPSTDRWRADDVWMSCDGKVGVTRGPWWIKGAKLPMQYEAIWARLGDGTWRFLLFHGGQVAWVHASHPGRKGQRAACTGTPPPLPITAPDVGTDFKMGTSRDQTLIWSSAVSAKGEVRIVISLWNGKTFDPVLEDVAPAPAPR